MHIIGSSVKNEIPTQSLSLRGYQIVEKVCFFKKVLVLNPYPQTPSPWEGAILLGLPPLVPVGGYAPATPFLSTIEVFRQSDTHAEFITAWVFSLRCLRHVLHIILRLSVVHFGINTVFDFHKFIVRTVLLYRIIGKYGNFIAEFTA